MAYVADWVVPITIGPMWRYCLSAFCYMWQSEMPLIFATLRIPSPLLPPPPPRYIYTRKCETNMSRPPNRLHTLGISSSGCDVKKINGSLTRLTVWLPGHAISASGVGSFWRKSSQAVVLSGQTSTSCPECEFPRSWLADSENLNTSISSGFQWTTHSLAPSLFVVEIRGKSFLPLDWHRLSAFMLHFEEKENENSSVHYNPRLESPWLRSRAPSTSGEIDRDTTRRIASPQRALFPWQLGIRKFIASNPGPHHFALLETFENSLS